LAEQIDKLASSGDLVMCLGAGTVTAWAAALPEQLAELRNTPLVTEAGQ
jgi:UDP-N-acetylmuramate--alanine ligase